MLTTAFCVVLNQRYSGVSLCIDQYVNNNALNTLYPISQIMSLHLRYISFLWQVADLGCNLNMPLLRDGARVLMKLMPPGIHAIIQFI